MNTLHQNGATLASFNATDVYDSEGMGLRDSPPLQPKTLRLRLTPTPPPKMTEVSRSSPISPSSSRRRSSNRRPKKIKKSLGQMVLLQFMADGRNPDIANYEPSSSSEDEDNEGDEEDDDESIISIEPEPVEEESGEEKDRSSSKNNRIRDNESMNTSYSSTGRSYLQPRQLIMQRQTQKSPSEPDQESGHANFSNGKDILQRLPLVELGRERDGDQVMSSVEIKKQPTAADLQQSRPRAGSHDYAPCQHQGQGHDRQTARQQPSQFTPENSPTIISVPVTTGLTPGQSVAEVGDETSAERALYKASDIEPILVSPAAIGAGAGISAQPFSVFEQPGSRSPGTRTKRDHNGMPKPATTEPGKLRMDSNTAVGANNNAPSPNQSLHQHQGFAAALYPLHRDGSSAPQQEWHQRQPDQSHLLTSASTMSLHDTLPAPTTLFPPMKTRDDRSLAGSTPSESIPTPSSTQSPSDHTSPFSTISGGGGGSASLAAFSPQSDFHMFRPLTSNILPPLSSLQRYKSSTRREVTSAASPLPASSPANSSTGAACGSPQKSTLAPTLPHISCLVNQLNDSDPTGTDPRQSSLSYIQQSPRFVQLPPIGASPAHRSSPTSPNEIYRRGSDVASPASSVSNVGSHSGSGPFHYPPSAPSSSYGGSRHESDFNGRDTPASETQYSTNTPSLTGRPAVSPGRKLHPIPTMASPLPGPSTMLTIPTVRHELLAPRQQQQRPPPPAPPPVLEPAVRPSSHGPSMDAAREPQQSRPTLPANSQHSQGPYKCDEPGCNASPFLTQYLLNSHANVHSSNRPHYCPEPGCPRGKTGQGFKRKNEMIRHGLVHRSPGYVCPFCPDREHKYPRPDNLQRCVTVTA